MSADVVDKLFKCSLEVPLLHTEDVYLTGICSKYMGIKLTNNYRFTCNKNDSHVCLDPKAWTRHYYTAATIRETYFILKNNGCEKLKRYSVLMVKFWKIGVALFNYGDCRHGFFFFDIFR